MSREPILYRRHTLYGEVWKEPLLTVSKRYGVSDVALAKVCRRLAVPLPGRGHWARVAAGQVIERVPLRRLPKDRPDAFLGRRPKPTAATPATHALVEQERTPEARIVVREVLTNPHRLVALSARAFNKKGEPRHGRRSLRISVSVGLLDRALRVMDALLKAMEARGLKVEVTPIHKPDPNGVRRRTGVEPNDTRVLVDGEWVSFGITEVAESRELPPATPEAGRRSLFPPSRQYERVPTGRLSLYLRFDSYETGRRHWAEGKRQRLEDRLNEFLGQVYLRAETQRKQRERYELARREREEEERLRREAAARAQDEERRAKDLSDQVARWRFAREVRRYVREMHAICASVGRRVNPDGPYGALVAWAEEYAERIDPLTPMREEAERIRAEETQGPAPSNPSGEREEVRER